MFSFCFPIRELEKMKEEKKREIEFIILLMKSAKLLASKFEFKI